VAVDGGILANSEEGRGRGKTKCRLSGDEGNEVAVVGSTTLSFFHLSSTR
jgi:hypothetical protein